MNKIVKYELKKIMYNKWLIYSFLVILALLGFTTGVIIYAINHPDFIISGVRESWIVTGNSVLNEAYSNSNIVMVLSVLVSTYVCTIFSNGVLKNELSTNENRAKLFIGKYIALIISTTILSFITGVTAFIMGTVYGGAGADFGIDSVLKMLVQIIVINGYASLFYAVSLIIKKYPACIVINLLLPSIIELILVNIDKAIFEGRGIYGYWIESMFERLSGTEILSISNYVEYIVFAVIYCMIFALVGILKIKKVEM